MLMKVRETLSAHICVLQYVCEVLKECPFQLE